MRVYGTESPLGLVPTLGYLHEGHLSLIRRAREECVAVVVSVFVNPLQFGPNEDLARYPRDPERDSKLAREAGADALFMPEAAELYPEGFKTEVRVRRIEDVLEGRRGRGTSRGWRPCSPSCSTSSAPTVCTWARKTPSKRSLRDE